MPIVPLETGMPVVPCPALTITPGFFLGWCRCLGVSAYCRNLAPITPEAPAGSVSRCIGVLLQSCVDRSQGLPGPVYRYIGVLLQFCADRSRYCAILRRSLRGSLRVGVSAYCLFLGVSSGRCVGVSASFDFSTPFAVTLNRLAPLNCWIRRLRIV